jgi:hypothetical protein
MGVAVLVICVRLRRKGLMAEITALGNGAMIAQSWRKKMRAWQNELRPVWHCHEGGGIKQVRSAKPLDKKNMTVTRPTSKEFP